tara:strand:- start:553 stop:2460 length:1908 start_codon:yes stop_codon:yes gene_type:complete
MATVNRYTQVQPSVYNPRSLQELMIAPQYMRQQHDAVETGLAQTEAALAQVDPLDIHSETARMEQQKIYDNITGQAEALNKEGFSPSSKSQFLKVNSQYQKAIAPTGTLGRIGKAKEALNANKDQYLQNAIESGYSPEAALSNWGDFQGKYEEEFAKSGKVTNIGEMYAPKYYDYISEGQKLFKDAGVTSTDLASGSGKIVQDEQGSYVVNSQSRDVNENNVGQLKAAVDFLNNRMMNPNSDAYKSIQHQRKTPQDAIKELTGLADVYVKSKTGEQRQSSIGSFSPKVKDDETRSPNYVQDILKGYDIKNIADDSPIKMIGRFEDAAFETDKESPNYGNLIAGDGKYKTYEEKIAAMRESNSYSTIVKDQTTGLYKATPKAAGNAGVGSYNGPATVLKDPLHYQNELNQLRTDNPVLSDLNDKELIDRLSSFSEDLESNYVTSLEIPNANYEWMNDRLFGNTVGGGERGSGIIDSKGATINGKSYTAKEVVDQLGFKSSAEFKTLGEPTVRGYSTAFGKWRVATKNSAGDNVDVFVDDITEFKQKTALSRTMADLAFQGKAFAKIKETADGQALYFVNDFVNPVIVKYNNGVLNAAGIPQEVIEKTGSDFQTTNFKESSKLVADPLFKLLSNVKD